MSYPHLTTSEWGRIQELRSLGFTRRAIAKRLGWHHSTIDRELARSSAGTDYDAEMAQHSYCERRKRSKPQGKKSPELISLIAQKLEATWSPEQIANTVTKDTVSFKTIYNWIYAGALPKISIKNLRHKGKRRKGEKRGKFSMGTPISKRPKEVTTRETFGHWELDSMVSSRGESKGCFATFVERKSRLYTAIKTPDRTAASMLETITHLYNVLPTGAFQTGTTDRGKEFAC